MKTLKFISAESLVSNAVIARRNLPSITHNLYPLLFKASYLLEQGEIIHDLVENWPLEDLNLGKLLGSTLDHQEDICHWTCRVNLEACLTGLRDYVLNCSATYTKRLKVVNLTGIKDVEVQLCKCKKTLGRWERTKLLSQLCWDLLVEMQKQQFNPAISDITIDVLVNLFVTERSYDLVVQVLLMRCHSPLKIRCMAFRADSLALRKFFYIIKLTEPACLRKLEVVHNIRLQMEHLEVLLNNVNFPQLTSLTLPARTFNVDRFTSEDEVVFTRIGEKLSNMTHLTQLSLAFSILSGKIRKLLSPLKTPLKALDVANCSLNHVDMIYLANSLHSEHLEVLDLSGHNMAELYPSTFLKILGRASRTLRILVLEECNLSDTHVNMMTLGLMSCQQLEEFKFLGNPLSSRALKCLFSVFTDLPVLKYIEFPVPKDCYPLDITYPLEETSLSNFDHEKYEEIREELNLILLHANREDIIASTPLYGCYDPDIQETGNELGAVLVRSFKEVIDNLLTTLQNIH
ncbi:leucine-rich repeat-containing protein 14B [Microcaecilia unicolor]|uniref:Leucine-rich repeat-containing protein 14B n=1 Tax=Microcaecilia unicolor TaxID=1415580 RepID=A0A6P7X6X3_9AMPH|nr:leucine-rich repeat-containing protein 14B [Microcaecilia unicolor]